MQSNGGPETQDQLKKAHQDLQDAADAIDEHTYAIVEQGIILGSVERRLADFPAMRDDRIVYQCWLAGETEITHWHEVDAGGLTAASRCRTCTGRTKWGRRAPGTGS